MMLGGSSSATEIMKDIFEPVSPGRFDRASSVAGSGGAPRPAPKPRPPGPPPRPAAGAPGGPPFGEAQGANAPPCTGGGVTGRMSKAGGDMKITPLRPMP